MIIFISVGYGVRRDMENSNSSKEVIGRTRKLMFERRQKTSKDPLRTEEIK